MIDFHCHLDLYPQPDCVAQECAKRGVYVLSVTTTPSAWYRTSELGKNRTRTALGLHPQLAHERKAELSLFDALVDYTSYIGEIGLDGTPEFRIYWKDQITVFHHILGSCSRAGGRIMSIHSRFSSKVVLEFLRSHPNAGIPVLHWFSGSAKDLTQAIEMGCWFSVGVGMLNSERGKSLTARIPRERILTESDGPFAQIDGRAVLPWEIGRAVDVLTDIWGNDRHETEEILKDNLRHITERLDTTFGT